MGTAAGYVAVSEAHRDQCAGERVERAPGEVSSGSGVGGEAAHRRRIPAQQATRRGGTGGLHHGGQRDSESGRGNYKAMNPVRERELMLTRRQLLGRAATGIGTAALTSLLAPAALAEKGLPGFPNFPPKAKRIIYLHQSGAPSQMDLFDPKPGL